MEDITVKINDLGYEQKQNLFYQIYHRFFNDNRMFILPYVEYMGANKESYLHNMLWHLNSPSKWLDAMTKGVKSYMSSGYVYKPTIRFMLEEASKKYGDYKDFVELPKEEVDTLVEKSVEYIQNIVEEEYEKFSNKQQ